MRSFYEMKKPAEGALRDRTGAAHRRAIQLITLVFWAPCCAVDLWLLLSARAGGATTAFVFGLLFRESLVFLSLWFVTAAAHGLMRGSRLPPEPTARERRRLRAFLDTGIRGHIAPTRGNRGQ